MPVIAHRFTRRSTEPEGDMSTGALMKAFRWVDPVRVAQIRFREWTRHGRIREAAYAGLRIDKAAKDVHREA